MSGKIEISRELVEVIEGYISGQADAFPLISVPRGQRSDGLDQVSKELRALLAAPVVERQEPVAYIVEAIDPNNGHLRRRGLHWHSVETLRGTRDFKEWIGENLTKEQPLYTSPPAPVAVAVDERAEFESWAIKSFGLTPDHFTKDEDEYTNYPTQCYWDVWRARACLDKVKELNH